MKALNAALLILGIPCLYALLTFGGALLIGAGHGTDCFAEVCLAPFSAVSRSAWVLVAAGGLWVLVGVLLAMRRYQSCRLAAAALLLFHYGGVVFLSMQREDWHVAKVWDTSAGLISLLAALYFSSQALMWGLIIWRRNVP